MSYRGSVFTSPSSPSSSRLEIFISQEICLQRSAQDSHILKRLQFMRLCAVHGSLLNGSRGAKTEFVAPEFNMIQMPNSDREYSFHGSNSITLENTDFTPIHSLNFIEANSYSIPLGNQSDFVV